MARHSVHLSSVCLRTKALAFGLLALTACAAPTHAQSAQDPIYVFQTSLGNIDVQLFPDVAPQTVANFLDYVGRGDYNYSIIHRSAESVINGSVSKFVIQGGEYQIKPSGLSAIPAAAPVLNEFHLSNLRGTIAMAKVGGDPNSATSQWFFNEGDNSANLDNQNGGFTVFGKITNAAGLAVMDKIGAEPIQDRRDIESDFGNLPVIPQTGSGGTTYYQYVVVGSIAPVPAPEPSSLTVLALGLGTVGLTVAVRRSRRSA